MHNNFYFQLCERERYCYNMSINSRRARIGTDRPKYFRTNRYDMKPSKNNLPKFYLCLDNEICSQVISINFNRTCNYTKFEILPNSIVVFKG